MEKCLSFSKIFYVGKYLNSKLMLYACLKGQGQTCLTSFVLRKIHIIKIKTKLSNAENSVFPTQLLQWKMFQTNALCSSIFLRYELLQPLIPEHCVIFKIHLRSKNKEALFFEKFSKKKQLVFCSCRFQAKIKIAQFVLFSKS